jgi:hypothetical protein
LAGSRRGGNFTHFRKPRTSTANSIQKRRPEPSIAREEAINVASHAQQHGESLPQNNDPLEESICAELQNPLDALQILAKVAVNNDDYFPIPSRNISASSSNGAVSRDSHDALRTDVVIDPELDILDPAEAALLPSGIGSYRLIAKGVLEPKILIHLLRQ